MLYVVWVTVIPGLVCPKKNGTRYAATGTRSTSEKSPRQDTVPVCPNGYPTVQLYSSTQSSHLWSCGVGCGSRYQPIVRSYLRYLPRVMSATGSISSRVPGYPPRQRVPVPGVPGTHIGCARAGTPEVYTYQVPGTRKGSARHSLPMQLSTFLPAPERTSVIFRRMLHPASSQPRLAPCSSIPESWLVGCTNIPTRVVGPFRYSIEQQLMPMQQQEQGTARPSAADPAPLKLKHDEEPTTARSTQCGRPP